MLDTNQLQEISDRVAAAQAAAQAIKIQINPWLPALAIAAAWLGRELNRLATWSTATADKIIAHGGLFKLIAKVFYNSKG
jgi:hypothetical protein